MDRDSSITWLRALLVGLVVFLPWNFFFASPSHLDSYGLLKERELNALLFGAVCSMVLSSLFCCYPLKIYWNNKLRLLLNIFNHNFRLFILYILILPRMQINYWTCWGKDTFSKVLVYTYNTLRDKHYLKAIDQYGKCPPSAATALLLEDIELERLRHQLMYQDYECTRNVAAIMLALVILYCISCNILGFFCSGQGTNSDHRKTRTPKYNEDEEDEEQDIREIDATALLRKREQ